MFLLRSGEVTRDRRLDRCRHVDLRSLNYPVSQLLTTDQYTNPRSYTWGLDLALDQGSDGACVGFAVAHELAARPGVITGVTNSFAHERIYWLAQRLDDWAGGSYPGAYPEYEGTSVLAGAKAAKSLGYLTEYRWALNIADLITAIGYRGPAIIGVDWFEGMMETDNYGYIHPTGQILGGHCVCVLGVRIVRKADTSVDYLRSYFIIQNSWSSGWGISGRCAMTFAEMLELWPGSDFCIPTIRVTGSIT